MKLIKLIIISCIIFLFLNLPLSLGYNYAASNPEDNIFSQDNWRAEDDSYIRDKPQPVEWDVLSSPTVRYLIAVTETFVTEASKNIAYAVAKPPYYLYGLTGLPGGKHQHKFDDWGNALIKGRKIGGWVYTGQKISFGVAGMAVGGMISGGVGGVLGAKITAGSLLSASSGAIGVGVPYVIDYNLIGEEKFGPVEMSSSLFPSFLSVGLISGTGRIMQTQWAMEKFPFLKRSLGKVSVHRGIVRATLVGSSTGGAGILKRTIKNEETYPSDIVIDFTSGATASGVADALRIGLYKTDDFFIKKGYPNLILPKLSEPDIKGIRRGFKTPTASVESLARNIFRPVFTVFIKPYNEAYKFFAPSLEEEKE